MGVTALDASSALVIIDLQLRRRGVTQVVLAGLTTSIGVESTARAAYEHGYQITLAADAMADLDVAAHRNSTERIFPPSARPAPPPTS